MPAVGCMLARPLVLPLQQPVLAARVAAVPGIEGRDVGKAGHPIFFQAQWFLKKLWALMTLACVGFFFGVCVQQTVILPLGSPNTSNAMKCYQDMQN